MTITIRLGPWQQEQQQSKLDDLNFLLANERTIDHKSELIWDAPLEDIGPQDVENHQFYVRQGISNGRTYNIQHHG